VSQFAGTEGGLDRLRSDARSCTACPLYLPATQTVFGEGLVGAPMMLVGEQPGDQEDVEGLPFVGPAGRLLRALLDRIDLPAEQLYVTNAVKHFKFEQRGKRRIHQKPNRTEMVACRPWLEAELAVVQPKVVVALGVTAASSLLEKTVVLRKVRGLVPAWPGPGQLVVTIHPSAILRAEPGPARDDAERGLVADLTEAKRLLDAA
jgi:DNA polymerase